jgi:prophage ps3 protein
MRALDLAAHVSNRCMDLDMPTTHFKLQKMLYILEVKSLIHSGKSLIDENFEAWEYGPFLRSVYDKYSYMAACEIKVRQKTNHELPSDQRNAIINNIDELAKMNLWELAQISMEADTPWAKVYEKDKEVKIPNQLIVSYAKALRESISKESQINKSVRDISIN